MPRSLTPTQLGVVSSFEGEVLHCAAIFDQDQFLNDLLMTGENGTVDSVDKFGRTPLHTAAFYGSIKCVKVLVQKGGKIEVFNCFCIIEASPLKQIVTREDILE